MTRREFLKAAVYLGAGGYTTLILGPEITWSQDKLQRRTESLGLKLRNIPEPESVLFGSYYPLDRCRGNRQSYDNVNPLSRISILYPSWNKPEANVCTSQDLEGDWGVDYCRRLNTNGRLPLISIAKTDSTGRFDWSSLKEEEGRIIQIAREFKDVYGLLRPFWEFNGNWYRSRSPDNNQESFKDSFRLLGDIFRSEAPNIKIVWCPNTTVGAADFSGFYPGSRYVDLIALDGYRYYSEDIFNIRHYYRPNLTFGETFGPDLVKFQELYPDKNIIIAETGASGDDRGSPDWLAGALAEAVKIKGVRGVCGFFENKQGVSDTETDWNVLDKPGWPIISLAVSQNPAYLKSAPKPEKLIEILLKHEPESD